MPSPGSATPPQRKPLTPLSRGTGGFIKGGGQSQRGGLAADYGRHALAAAQAPLQVRPRFAVRAVLPTCVAVVAYAIAMAYVESAAVLYLRTIYGGVDPVGLRPRDEP